MQYLLYAPFLVKGVFSSLEDDGIDWCTHILIICALRATMYSFWTSYCNMYFLNRTVASFKKVSASSRSTKNGTGTYIYNSLV